MTSVGSIENPQNYLLIRMILGFFFSFYFLEALEERESFYEKEKFLERN